MPPLSFSIVLLDAMAVEAFQDTGLPQSAIRTMANDPARQTGDLPPERNPYDDNRKKP